MLKRCQVLLEDWQIAHLKLIADKQGLSFTEMLRIILSEGLLRTCPHLHPEYRPRLNETEIIKIAVEGSDPKTTFARKKQLISKLLFEAQKAVEFMNEKLAKESKGKK